MSQLILSELEHAKKRLEYYLQQREKALATAAARPPARKSSKTPRPSPLDKWVEIYSERVQKLERQANRMARLGLKTQLASGGRASSRATI